MLTFNFHIGDFAKKTAHLNLVEKAIFINLLMRYYDTEQPLPAMPTQCERIAGVRSDSEKQALEFVISEFFFEKKGKLFNKRAEEEIARYKEKSIKAKASASKRWNANAMRTHSEGNANHEPRTTNHEPINREPTAPAKKIKVEIPSPFVFTDKHFELSTKSNLNIDEQFQAFTDYHKSKGNKFVDWHSAFSNWLRKATEFKKGGMTYAERDRAYDESRARATYTQDPANF